eukprot:12717076-Alexandrium_andersonii.AAC.1
MVAPSRNDASEPRPVRKRKRQVSSAHEGGPLVLALVVGAERGRWSCEFAASDAPLSMSVGVGAWQGRFQFSPKRCAVCAVLQSFGHG